LQYTAMGDTINLASRLEGINKTYGTAILVSQTTAARCGDAFAFRKVDTVQAKGRTESVTVYELVSARSGVPARPMVETVA
ncbi:adenylate/guanylate cyclase domain-containing protein, partial [Chelatococcus reniformis]|uniref:adenylate/guanylate cyclase domain-containing protein n=1 Tax=Chelatococcus reniformis TaxID=1494448 RepID=UPI00166802A2